MEGNGVSVAILVGVWATFALDVFGSLTSSPQTTEINARARADTLMKWVGLATAVAIGGGVAASMISKRIWPALAAGAVALSMYGLYAHAKRRGLEQGGEPTESY